jgi:fumarate reductase subunit C
MSKRYEPKQSWSWFLKRPAYVRFMVRELTAVAVGAYLVFLLFLLSSLAQGRDAFIGMLACLESPVVKVLHVIVLAGALYHSITWFNLTPRAVPLFFGEKRAPAALVAIGMGYLPWLVITAIIVWGTVR